MKLYTEEQVKEMLNKINSVLPKRASLLSYMVENITEYMTPIELPSDLKDFHKWIEDNEWYFNPISFNGVIQYRWVKEFWIGQETTDELYKIYIEEQISNQNK